MDEKLMKACEGKTASQGGLNVSDLKKLPGAKGKTRKELLDSLCKKTSSVKKPKTPVTNSGMDEKLRKACEGKTASQGGLNVSDLKKLPGAKGKTRKELLDSLCKKTSSVRKPKTPVRKPKTPVRKPKTPVRKPKTPVRKPKTPVSNKTHIKFNSKAKEYNELSNFYGGVEACYMKDRFENKEIKNLFDKFDSANKEDFLMYLKELQPSKKWNDAKLNYWFSNGKPITGILSKLAGGSVKNGPTAKKRLQILKRLSKTKGEVKIRKERTNDEKIDLMMKCLRQKYSKPYYKKLLLSTGNAILHEVPMRGKGDFWTLGGEDTLGKLLMKIRDELRKSGN